MLRSSDTGNCPTAPIHAAAQHQHVGQAVVVVVGVHQVEAAGQAVEAARRGALLEAAGAGVAEDAHRIVEADRRDHHVEEAVAIEVLEHGAARQCRRCASPTSRRDVGERRDRCRPRRRRPVGMRSSGGTPSG